MPPRKNQQSNIVELPSVFSIDKYAGTSTFTNSQWAKAIAFRKALVYGYGVVDPLKCILEVLNKPLDTDAHVLNVQHGVRPGFSVKHLQVKELHSASRFIQHEPGLEEAADEVKAYFDRLWCLNSEPLTLSSASERFMNMPVDELGGNRGICGEALLLKLNLECADSELVEEFMDLVKKARCSRKMNQQKRDITDADILRWNEFEVLAYVDLFIWSRFVEKKIPLLTFGKALFPKDVANAVNLAERVRQVVRPAANEMFSNYVVSTMWAKAKKESGTDF